MTYKTVREAGIAGSLEALRRGRLNGWEYGGYLTKNPDGTFGVSKIVTSRDAHNVSLGDALPEGVAIRSGNGIEVDSMWWDKHIAGMFHSHVAYMEGYSQYHEWFSPNDLQVAASTGGFAYLGAAQYGRVFELDARSHDAIIKTTVEKDVDLDTHNGRPQWVPVGKGILVYQEGRSLIR